MRSIVIDNLIVLFEMEVSNLIEYNDDDEIVVTLSNGSRAKISTKRHIKEDK